MKKYAILLLAIAALASCSPMKRASKSILPCPVKSDVYFGMSLDEFKKIKDTKSMTTDNGMTFREVYIESVNGEEIDKVIYYFDDDGEQPLYEVIMEYHDDAKRNEVAKKIFGKPNYEGKEWRMTRSKTYNVWAWTFKKKLVVVAMLPGTEWSDQDWE